MRRLRTFALAGLAGLLAACGTERGEVFPAIAGAARSALALGGPAPDLRTQLTPQVLAAIDGPLILVEIPEAPSQAGLSVAGTNGGYVTWAAENSTLVITRGGVVTGTRGLGFDLMNTDLGGTLAAIASGGGSSTRVHRFLDGEGKVLARSFACHLSTTGHEVVRLVTAALEASRVSETCEGALGGRFVNDYWVAGGEVIKSKQWISPQIGYMLVERVK